MEPEEKDIILPESEPEPAVCADPSAVLSESAEPCVEPPAETAAAPVSASSEKPDAAEPDFGETPTLEALEDGSRILRIPRGYEAFPDGWYPKNPLRRFMERWGAFLNLGLTLVLLGAVLTVMLTFRPVPEPDVNPTGPAELSTEPSQIVPIPPEQAELPTMPATDIPVQTDCFTATDGVLSFALSAFEPTPILRLPDTVDGQEIIAIEDRAFEGLSGVTTLILPEGLRAIGERAFAECPDLRGVVLPSSAKQVGSEAFEGCSALESVFLPGTLLSVGADAFENCGALYYIFFNGPHSRWQKLYTAPITPFTFIFCNDGEFPHGAQLSE